MGASITLNGLSLKQKNIITRVASLSNTRQIDFLDFTSKMTEWEYEVFDAFRSRLRVDDIIERNTQTAKNYHLFLDNPDDEVAKLLVSERLHKWRPSGIGIFAELVRIHQSRNDDAIIKAIVKASSIAIQDFKIEYPAYNKNVTPKSILLAILKEDFEITLSSKKPDTKKVYDGVRKNSHEEEI